MDWASLIYGALAGGAIIAVVDLLVALKREARLQKKIDGQARYIDTCHEQISRGAQIIQWMKDVMTPEQLTTVALQALEAEKGQPEKAA